MNHNSMEELIELTKSNSRESYDKLWRDEGLLNTYLEPARIEAYMTIIRYVATHHYGNRIIDIGVGSGDFLRLLSENIPNISFEIYGIDYCKSAVKRAARLIPKGQFAIGDIYNLPYSSDFFDQVFCIQTLEHIKYPNKALAEMDRVCKPGGRILISVPNGELDTFEGHVNFWKEADFKNFLASRELCDFIVFNENRTLMASVKPLK